MAAQVAYIAVILIWATTPLAVKWSGEGSGALLGVLGRMSLAATFCTLLTVMLRIRIPWHKSALRVYASAALGVYGAMLCVYLGAQYVPSGIVAVLFGLTPLMTGVLARFLLNENNLGRTQLSGMLLGLAGLMVIFGSDNHFGINAMIGVSIVVLGVLLHSISTVLVKRSDSDIPGLALASGALLVSVPMYLLTWWIFDGHLPNQIPERTLVSTVYLGLVGSVVGFTLFYHVLRNMSATAVGLVPLLSPVLALILGQQINGEIIEQHVWTGTALILSGLLLYQWGHKVQHRLSSMLRAVIKA